MTSRCYPLLRLRRVRVTQLDECGRVVTAGLATDEITTLTEGGSGLTSYTITVNGQTTASIDDDANAATVQLALEALSNVAPGDVVVTGTTNPIALDLVWGGTLAGTDMTVTTTPTGGTGTVVVSTLIQGDPGDPTALNVVSDGAISLAYEDDNEEGDEFIQKNGWGDLCINDRADSVFKRANVTISFCNVDPELFSIVLGVDLIVDGNGDAIGYRKSEGLLNHRFGLEGWAGVPGVECTADNLPYGYAVFPHISDGKLSSAVTFENGTTTFEMTGFTRPGSAWGVGPYDVQSDFESPTPGFGPLDPPFGTLEHYRKFLSDAPVPAASCGIASV